MTENHSKYFLSFFDETEDLVQSVLMKDNKEEYLRKILSLIEEYKEKILGEDYKTWKGGKPEK